MEKTLGLILIVLGLLSLAWGVFYVHHQGEGGRCRTDSRHTRQETFRDGASDHGRSGAYWRHSAPGSA